MPTVGIQREKYGYTINNENIQSSTEENRKVLFAERNPKIITFKNLKPYVRPLFHESVDVSACALFLVPNMETTVINHEVCLPFETAAC